MPQDIPKTWSLPVSMQVEMDNEPIYVVDADDHTVARIERTRDQTFDMKVAGAMVDSINEGLHNAPEESSGGPGL